ncbi:hypothetical protein C41B8_12434 [Salinisphaera hydrothermalis C41B8]|uniref:D-apionate lactonase N-terminal domain-containing protein n=3 Tax=Salinisphaera TaxID=180541 RepID=A0A084IJJ6_SALHC|nr:hypothetical protein C41B8_12434 [Salinisphaera hydrothermalis C41B8]
MPARTAARIVSFTSDQPEPSMSVSEAVRIRRVGTPTPETVRERHVLGPVCFTWQSGAIRHLSVDGVEVLRGIGAVIRDANWGTHALHTEADEAHSSDGAIAFTYCARVATDGDGSGESPLALELQAHIDATELDVRLTLTAREHFVTCRSGLSVLLPLAGVVESAVAVEHSDGLVEKGHFPRHISPSQPFFDIRGLSFAPTPERTVDLHFEGDVFEMEDQRNWSDASFKIYNRPLALPSPYRIEAGETVTQSVRLRWRDTTGAAQ